MSNQSEAKRASRGKWLAVYGGLSVAVVLLQVGGYFLIDSLAGDDRGTFGDMFGAVNTLFSGLALSALIITMLMQQEDIQLQYQELRESRDEFKKATAAQEGLLSVARTEMTTREARDRRAATLLLYPWTRHGGEQREDGIPAWRFSATNLGSMVTGLRITLESGTRLGTLTMNPCPILPTQGKLTITIRQIDEMNTWVGKDKWPTAKFRIEYVDATGEKRMQGYDLQGEDIVCEDLGID